MPRNSFLDQGGLGYLWSKVLSRISSSESSITAKIPIASDDLPKDLGSSSSGVSSKFSRSDHVHKVPDDIVSYADAQTGVEETTKINADLLENHPASDFAPGGFGLGEKPKYIADANDAVKNGWYTIDESTLNLPGPNMSLWNYTYLRVDVGGRPDIYIKQTITSPYQNWHQCEVTRCFYRGRGGWQPWEWVNPPLLLGVEYRTTERYLGNPVYVKTTDCGAIPERGSTKNVVDTISNMEHLVSYGGDTYNDAGTDSLPYYGGENRRIEVDASKFGIGLWNVGIDITANVIIWRKYTKTTN